MSIDPNEDEESGDDARGGGHATPGTSKSPSHQNDEGRNGEPIIVDGNPDSDRLQASSTPGMSVSFCVHNHFYININNLFRHSTSILVLTFVFYPSGKSLLNIKISKTIQFLL